MAKGLGRWALIDIETTGTDPLYDQIIDVGFLQFEGTKLIRTYSSLVQCEEELSFFIQKLTGITNKMVKRAPAWDSVEPDVMDLYGHELIAHNADFEKSFLSEHFEKIADETEREKYRDSLFYLALLFPEMSSLKLENFIIKFGIADHEEHRGLQDSIDLLKVLLIATVCRKKDMAYNQYFQSQLRKYELENWWFAKFYNLDYADYQEMAEAIDYDLEEAMEIATDKMKENHIEMEIMESDHYFPMEFSGDNIKNIFRSEEKIQDIFPNYKYRKSQEDLSLRVGQSFKNGVHALVQAPTGTGKTMGYLIPAALFAINEQKQVLVSTGTKTLQQQAMKKDVPQLKRIMGLGDDMLKVRRLVGSGNHMCELLFRQELKEEDLLFSSKDFEEKISDMFLEMVFFHNSRAEIDDQILRGDIPFFLKTKLQNLHDMDKEIAVDFRACTGNNCPFKHDCTYIKGLREAKDANIIIGNHALMFSWPRGFPRPVNIVVDEAHKIEEETTKAYSLEAEQEGLEGFARSLQNLQGLGSLFYLLAQREESEGDSTPIINSIRDEANQTYQMLMDHLNMLPDLVEMLFKKRPRYTELFWNEMPMIKKEAVSNQLGKSIFDHFESILFILTNFAERLLPYSSRWEAKDMNSDQEVVAFTRFEAFMGQLEDLVLALDTSINAKPGYSHSMRFHEKQGYCLTSAPIDVGKLLHNQLLETSQSVVFTSATLGNANGDQGVKGVEWATGYSYLEPEKRFRKGLFLPATYDYENNTRVFLCDDTPPFYDANFVESTLKPVLKLIRDLGGRSLLLFSAKKRFETAREILLKEFDGEIPLFIQGMGNNVVEDFKESGEGILLGMESFGEGIDIPGKALQFVFIDKIPDMRMDQVINVRRDFYESNIGNEFTDYYLAHRTRALHQKLGRLVRTEKDIGGVIIVDNRIKKWKGKTMEKLVKMMEPYQLRRSKLADACEEVKDFIVQREQ